jgi:UDP-glucuronate 4-epimerase
MRALITGCAGFIGSHLTDALLADGESVLGVDCFNNNYDRPQKLENLQRAMDHDGFEFVPIDLARGDLQDLIDEAEVVFHLAAEPGVRPSWGERFEQYVRNNVFATQHLLEAAQRSPQKRFVYASSSSIYGDAERLPTPESVTPAPVSPYGVTKLAGEHLCQSYHANYGVATVMLRYFSVYGPRQRPDMAFDILFRAARSCATFELFGDGSQSRDFTYVDDVVTATRAAADSQGVEGRVFNVGGGSRVSLNEVIELASRISDRPIDVRRVERQAGDVRDTGADIGAAMEDLGFEPETSLEDGLRRQWEWVDRESALERIRS